MGVILEFEQTVDVSPEVAFAAMTDWPSQGRWMLGTTVSIAKGTGREVGDELAAFTGVGPVGFLDTIEITELTDSTARVLHTGAVVRGPGWMGVRPQGGSGTVMYWGEDLELPWGRIGRVGWPLVKPFMVAGVRRSLRRLAVQLEQESRRPGARSDDSTAR